MLRLVNKRVFVAPPARHVVVKAPVLRHKPIMKSTTWADVEVASNLVGKSIVLFTMFYTTMNWWFYKRTREELEENEEKDTEE